MQDLSQFEGLSKKERKRLKRQLERTDAEKTSKQKQFSRYIIYFFLLAALLLGAFYLYKGATTPKPGEKFPDLGRDHVTDISNEIYNSNPPTSGPHFAVWAKRGVYDRILSDGYLIHSLEHGYIVLSYNCSIKNNQPEATSSSLLRSLMPKALAVNEDVQAANETTGSADTKPLSKLNIQAQGEMSAFTPENPPSTEVPLPKEFATEACKSLTDKLDNFLEKFQRIIIVPRPNMDNKIALTAWTRLEKFNDFDEKRIANFIKAFHNRGPERTTE